MKKFGLLPRIILAIALGICFGIVSPDWLIRIFATFNDLFGGFLSFVITYIIIAFIAPGIGKMGKNAGKLLGVTTVLAYVSTIIAGLVAFFAAKALYPSILKSQTIREFADPSESLLSGYFTIEMTPVMGVMSALLVAFILGIGMAVIKGDALQNVMDDFQAIIQKLIEKIIIPLLPIHIFGIFSNMTQGGEVTVILGVFAKVFIMVISLHILYLTAQYTAAGAAAKQNPFKLIKTMLPAYFTALGTQSSAATIPVTLKQAKQTGANPRCRLIRFGDHPLVGKHDYPCQLLLAIMMLMGQTATFVSYMPFILMLGVTMVAAPGVPGGAVMAALGILESMLGFDSSMLALMIALYLAQDSFGTACNVTGDGAITILADKLCNREKAAEPNLAQQPSSS